MPSLLSSGRAIALLPCAAQAPPPSATAVRRLTSRCGPAALCHRLSLVCRLCCRRRSGSRHPLQLLGETHPRRRRPRRGHKLSMKLWLLLGMC